MSFFDNSRYQLVLPEDGNGENEPLSYFALNYWLMSRIATEMETTDDDDVNAYVAGILTRDLMGRYPRSSAETPIRRKDTDVFFLAEAAGTPTERFRVYATNGDFRFINDGIFMDPEVTGHARVYYETALSSAMKTPRGRKVSETLEKLYSRYGNYVKILCHMRSEYLNISARLSEGELLHLQRQAQEGAAPGIAPIGRDAFLDAYFEWMQTGSDDAKKRVQEIAAELRKVDPGFRFQDIQ